MLHELLFLNKCVISASLHSLLHHCYSSRVLRLSDQLLIDHPQFSRAGNGSLTVTHDLMTVETMTHDPLCMTHHNDSNTKCSKCTCMFYEWIKTIIVTLKHNRTLQRSIGRLTVNYFTCSSLTSTSHSQQFVFISIQHHWNLSLIHIWRCRRSYACRSRW